MLGINTSAIVDMPIFESLYISFSAARELDSNGIWFTSDVRELDLLRTLSGEPPKGASLPFHRLRSLSFERIGLAEALAHPLSCLTALRFLRLGGLTRRFADRSDQPPSTAGPLRHLNVIA